MPSPDTASLPHPPDLILVDGSSYLFRAFHALPPLTNRQGQATGAIYGVANMLRKLREDFRPQRMAVVFDASGKTFRHEYYPQYKANRPPMPDELRSQIAPLHELVEAMGFPLISVPGVEADDVIGSYAQQATEQRQRLLISTGDKDLAQLVNPYVTLIDTMNDRVMDEAGVEAKFAVPPSAIVDYLALMGDTSDNIPGVPGVGPKTAAKWLQQYGTLDVLIAHAEEIRGKVGERLREHLDQLAVARQLTAIKTDLDLELPLAALSMRPPDSDRLRQIYRQLEFKSWLSELDGEDGVSDDGGNDEGGRENSGGPARDYQLILDEAGFQSWLERLRKADRFAFDTETTSLDYMQARIVGVSFAVRPGEAAYVPFGHDYPDAPDQLDEATVLGQLKPILEDPAIGKIGQNLKYDVHVLRNHGIFLRGIAGDTMLQSYVIDSTRRHNMDDMALRLLDRTTIHFEDIAGKGAKQLTFNQVDLQQAAPYAAEDADITLQLFEKQQAMLAAEPGLKQVYEEIERPLLPVLVNIEQYGVRVDESILRRQSEELAQRLLEIEQQSYDVAGERFNLASPKQIQQIFFDKLQLPVIRKTPKGQPSTAEDVLQALAEDYELPGLILQHRGLSKLKSTYTDKLPRQIDARTGRVHTSYNQTVAATGRLSSTDPNLQNIPIRTGEGRRIRKAFVAGAGYRLLAADYSQVELRIMAHLSGDTNLLAAFASGQDVHQATAAEVFGVSLDTVSGDQRRAAKAINFGLIYGMSAFGLAKQLGIERKAAQSYVDLYFERYPGVQAFMDRIREEAKAQGYVETVFGRRLYLPEINSRNGMRRAAAERTAINAPMQGTAADIIKRAMLQVDNWIRTQKPAVHMIMQVHDELVFEVKEDQLESAIHQIRNAMESAAELAVPLVVDVGVGDNWDEAH